MAGFLVTASGRANTVVQVAAAMQVSPVILVTSSGAFVNAGTATTAAPGMTTTGGQPNTVVVPRAGTRIRPVVVVDSSGQFVYA